MSLKISFAKKIPAKAKTIILTAFEGTKLGAAAKSFDKEQKGFITAALKSNPQFEGKLGQTLTLSLPTKGDIERVIILGLGAAKDLTALKCEEAGGKLLPTLKSLNATNTALLIGEDKSIKNITTADLAAHICTGAKLRAYNFDRYKKKDDKAKPLQTITAIYEHAANIKATYTTLDHIIQGTYTARDLVNEPPNHLYPAAYAKFIKDELKPLGVQVEVIDEKKMAKLGMDAILAVGKGSERQPRMVIMRWNGGQKTTNKKKDTKPFALVGKGVTFDTGGISLKPGAGMDEMKMDMGGSAAVIGTMKTLALQKAKANVVAIVGLAENMPSHNAYRPGDIIGSLSGKTIEVLNTDAEGRLVLADCLTHVQNTYSPSAIIDLATLTGAMMVALGHEYCGTFANDDTLWKNMEDASTTTGEKLWRMPLDKVWKKAMVSDVADLQNLGKTGRYGGACTAAGFLEHFIENDTPWAHMDIAGTAWRKSDQATVPKFGSGFGVRILTELIEKQYSN
ncbi:MAG: leucyl aminopeptidase [Alphaproteobacteria bacterium]